MVTGEFPCIRAGRFTHALNDAGWQHDVVCRAYPPQFASSYRFIDFDPYRTRDDIKEAVARSEAEIIHVHNEPNWPVIDIKEVTDKPVILNIHDLACARPTSPMDEYEAEAMEKADAHIWVTAEQRLYAADAGLCVDKPHVIVGNYASSSVFIDKPVLPHIGGIVYEGGCDPKGSGGWRDLTEVVDALDGNLHIYPGGADPGYGIVHEPVYEFPLLIHELTRFDWNLAWGLSAPGWMHSIPTKVFDGFAAGVPIITNIPTIKPFCDIGMGVFIEDLRDLPRVARLDPKPYKKAVMANRSRFTTEREIEKVAELYKALLGA